MVLVCVWCCGKEVCVDVIGGDPDRPVVIVCEECGKEHEEYPDDDDDGWD